MSNKYPNRKSFSRKAFLTTSPEETLKLGKDYAAGLQKIKHPKAHVLGLVGDLGSGKTTFVQGLSLGLGIKSRIISPTFILQRQYEILADIAFEKLYHLDVYRLTGSQVTSLGLDELFSSNKNIIVIEWAERIKEFLPSWVKIIEFSHTSQNSRKIVFK